MSGWVPGHVVASKYALVAILGRGGMGQVWRARHVELGSMVALKSLDPRLAESELGRARFLREAKAAAALNSPHVIQIHDYGVDGDTPYIAMELLEGASLAERLGEGPLSPAETMRVVDHVARAIGKAHEVGFVHRDLKPANVFLCRNEAESSPLSRKFWAVKVLDFGIAKAVEGSADFAATERELEAPSTETGAVIGTPHYMSPEQARGASIDARSDLWSLGVVTYECLVGERPFRGNSFGALVLAICSDPPPIPSEHAQVPAGFDAWFERALARDPKERFGSARELADALRLVLEPDAPKLDSLPAETPGEPPKSLEGTTSPASRSWRLPAVLLGVGAAVAGVWLVTSALRAPPASMETAASNATSNAALDSAFAAASVSASASALAPRPAQGLKARQLTFNGTALRPSVSEDGETVYFTELEPGGEFAISRLDAKGRVTRLAQLAKVTGLVAAPDGQSVLVVGGKDRIVPSSWQVVDAEGRVRAEGPGARFGAAWSTDGKSFAGFSNRAGKELIIQSLDGSSRTVVVTGTYQGLISVHWLARQNKLLVEVALAEDKRHLLLLSPDGGAASEVHVPLARWSALAATDDALLFVTMPTPTADILRFAFDPSLSKASERGETLVSGTYASTITASRDGSVLVYGSSDVRSALQLSETTESAPWQPLTRSAQLNEAPRFSPDGTKVGFVRITNQRGLAVLPLHEPAAGPRSEPAEPKVLSGPDEEIMSFAWGPDGSELVALVLPKGGSPTLMRYATTGGAPRPIATGLDLAIDDDTLSWAPAKRLQVRIAGNQNYALVDPDSGGSSMVLTTPLGWVFDVRADRDGNLALYRNVGAKEPDSGAWLIPSANGKPLQLSSSLASPIVFSNDGQAVYLNILPPRGPTRLESVSVDGRKHELLRELDFGSDDVGGVDVTPDGRRVVVSRIHQEQDLFRLE